jgi:hypothetical protein
MTVELYQDIFLDYVENNIPDITYANYIGKMVFNDLYLIHQVCSVTVTPYIDISTRKVVFPEILSIKEVYYLLYVIATGIIKEPNTDNVLKFVENMSRTYCLPKEYFYIAEQLCSQQL